MGLQVEGYCWRCEEFDMLNMVDTGTEEYGTVGLCSDCYNKAKEMAQEG